MNKSRRAELLKIVSVLESVETDLSDVEWDETNARDSMPSSFSESDAYSESERISEMLQDAIENVSDAIKQINEVIEI